MSKSNSFAKKPILKKRSMSEIMLQRSLSTSSLVKQAAAAVQAQQEGGRRRMGRRANVDTNDYMTFPFASRDGSSRYPSTRSSGIASPNSGRKHIHFNEQVAQCIAVDVRDDDEDDDDLEMDDGGIVMKVPKLIKKRPAPKKKKSKDNKGESKTIAMLPSTTLKPEDDDETSDVSESGIKHSSSGGLKSPVLSPVRSPVLSPSSSQETLRPTKKPSKLFFAGDEDDDDDQDVEKIDISPAGFSAKLQNNDMGGSNGGGGGLRRTTSSASLSGGLGGMRRTTSGIFRPVEEPTLTTAPTKAPSNGGLMGQFLKTVNTARDIVHVVWNVGWRS
jgi:hypothetical protein